MASFILWVTISAVSLFFSTILSEISSTFAAVLGSRAAVCSSKSRRSGFWKAAISSVIACLCPPERRPTLLLSLSSRPRSNSESFCLYSSFSCFVTPHLRVLCFPLRDASARFSSMDMVAAVPVMGSWNTRPRKTALLCSGSFVTSFPPMTICPPSTGHTPAIALSIVDFPAPFPPIIVTKSPAFRLRLRPHNAVFSFMVPLLNTL